MGKYDAHLAAIAALEMDAVPSEKLYLERLKQRYQQMNAVENQSEVPPDESLDDLKVTVDLGYEGLYGYQYELEQPDVDPHWSVFLTHQIDKYETLLGPMLADLAAGGLEYRPPLFDREQFQRDEQVRELQMELSGLEQFKSVTLAWAERHGALSDVEHSVEELNRKIAALQDRIQLEQQIQQS